MSNFDETQNGIEWPFAGVDEVGRGCIAGPVVACALVLPKGCKIDGVKDSKKLSKKQRAVLEKKIIDASECFAFGVVESKEIDETNILAATLKAMSIAIQGLNIYPTKVIVDGTHAPDCEYPVLCLKQGDSLSQTVAAASILAKEYRDRMMTEFCAQYPEYGFSSHKGYGTKKHFAAISEYGLCPLHRRTFLKVQNFSLREKPLCHPMQQAAWGPRTVSASIFAVH